MFYRLVHAFSEDAGNSMPPVLGVVYEEVRKENANARFAPVTKFLADKGIRVPRLLADVPERQAYATDFVEGVMLEDAAKEKGVDFIRLYRPVLEILKQLWSISCDDENLPALEPGFGPGLFEWEREFFVRQCVTGRYGIKKVPASAAKELEFVAERLAKEPKVLVHRDFQSANILYSGDDREKPWLIDYQGMRPGPAAYDVAALLFDPYVPMDGTSRKLLIDLASKLSPAAPSPETVFFAGVQRLCQAIGAFCRLSSAGQPQYEQYISQGLDNLHQAAHGAGLPAFAEFVHELMHLEKMR
jgi:aminoglycoside/choline kinase family phosphotransferase